MDVDDFFFSERKKKNYCLPLKPTMELCPLTKFRKKKTINSHNMLVRLENDLKSYNRP